MLIRCVLACLLLLGLPAIAGAEELQERATIQSQVHDRLWDEDFGALESMADSYRATKARTSSGLWKLTLFYVAIQRAFQQHGADWAHRIALAWTDRYPRSATAHLAYAQALPDPETARAYLEAHKDVAAQDPRWYEMMAEIACGQGWSRPRFAPIIGEALDRAPGYYPIYFAAAEYFSPRCGGSVAELEAFTRTAVERTRDTDGWGLYARIYWYASQTVFGDQLFTA